MGRFKIASYAELIAFSVSFKSQHDGLAVRDPDGGKRVLRRRNFLVLPGEIAGENRVSGLVDEKAACGAPAVTAFHLPAAKVRVPAELEKSLAFGVFGGEKRRGVAAGATGAGKGQEQAQEKAFHILSPVWQGTSLQRLPRAWIFGTCHSERPGWAPFRFIDLRRACAAIGESRRRDFD